MVDLESGPFAARIQPQAGGRIVSLSWRDAAGRPVPVLHPPPAPLPGIERPSPFGSWPLLPYANRAFDARMEDGDWRFPLPPGFDGHAIHGFGWQAAWEIVDRDANGLTIEHRREDGPDPYRYRARQSFLLDEAGLTIRLLVENRAARALPYGLGHHPWFPCAPDTRLTLKAEGALLFGPEFRATGRRELADGGPYASGALFRSEEVTAWNFLGWDGIARIETPSLDLRITLSAGENLRAPVVWAPAGADFLCVEPQSHAIGAPSLSAAQEAAPLRRLAPGEAMEAWLRIEAGRI